MAATRGVKIDMRKERRDLYAPPTTPVLVEVPPMTFVAIDGRGDPNTAVAYQEAVSALYAVAYALKFAIKRGPSAVDYAVMPLERLWWAEDMTTFAAERKGDWLWRMLIAQPPVVTADLFDRTVTDVLRKKRLATVGQLRLISFAEGLSAQVMHVGPYAAEAPTIAGLHDFIHQLGASLQQKHHEIYLNDPSRTSPDKLKTVIRQPIARPSAPDA